jgi:hypothetical protein
MAAMPTSIRFSQEARSYAFLTLAMIVAWYLAIRLTRERNMLVAVGFTMVAILLPYIHYWGGPVLAATIIVAAAVVLPDRERRQRLWQFVPGAVLAVALLIPWIAVILRQYAFVASEDTIPQGVSLVSFIGVFGRPFGNTLMMTPMGILAIVTSFASMGIAVWLARRNGGTGGSPHSLLWCFGMAFLPIAIMALIAEFTDFWWGIRAPNLTMVPVSVFCGAAIVGLWHWRRPAAVGLGAAVLILCSAGVWRCYAEVEKPNWERIASIVEQNERPGDVVVAMHSSWTPRTFDHYYHGSLDVRGLSRNIRGREAVVKAAMELWPEGGRMWFIPHNTADSNAPRILQEISSGVEAYRVGYVSILRLDYPHDLPDVETDDPGGAPQ